MSSYLDQIIKLQKRGTYTQQKGYLSPFYTLHLGPYGSENVLLFRSNNKTTEKRDLYPTKRYLSPFYTLHLGSYGSENVLLFKSNNKTAEKGYLSPTKRVFIPFLYSTLVALWVGKCPPI